MLELEEENEQLINKIKEIVKQNKQLREELKDCQNVIHNNISVAVTDKTEDKLTYEQWLETEEAEQLANAYAKAMNIDIKEVI